jgi:hypothetical protein
MVYGCSIWRVSVHFLTLIAVATLCLAQVFPDRSQMIHLWNDVRRELLGPSGPQYFLSNIKDTAFPRLRGTVVSSVYSKSEGILTIKLDGQAEAELKLVLRSPIKTFFREGDLVQFEGVPQSFTAKPFLVTMDGTSIGVPTPK